MKSLNDIRSECNRSIEFPLFDKTLLITSDRNIYTNLRKKYAMIANSVYQRYVQVDNQYRNLEDLVKSAQGHFDQLIRPAIQEVVNDALSIGLNILDVNTIYTECNNNWYFSAFREAYDAFADKYRSIQGQLASNRASRDDATTGVMATEIVYSGDGDATMNAVVLSAIAGAADKSQAKKLMKEIFNSSGLRADLRESFRTCVRNLHNYIVDRFPKKHGIRFGGFVTSTASNNASALFNNLQNGSLSNSQKQNFIQQILELNPYAGKYYLTFADMFPNQIAQFVRISLFFGTTDLQNSVNQILMQFVNDNIGFTEDEAHQCIMLLDDKAASYGMGREDAAPAYKLIEDRLAKLDLEYRTVNDVVFETRAEADSARIDVANNKDILENPGELIFRSDYTSLIEKIKNLQISQQMIDSYVNRYSKQLASFDNKCKKAAKSEYRKKHHNVFWNGDTPDMLIHYFIFAILLFCTIRAFVEKSGIEDYIVGILFLVSFSVYFWGIKAYKEKKLWNELTRNGMYSFSDITGSTTFPSTLPKLQQVIPISNLLTAVRKESDQGNDNTTNDESVHLEDRNTNTPMPDRNYVVQTHEPVVRTECPYCHTMNVTRSVFCKRCGQKMNASESAHIDTNSVQDVKEKNSIACPNCQVENAAGSIFCKSCGNRIK